MTDIGTLIEVCKIIDAQLQSIYEQKEDYSVGYDPQNNSLSIGDFAASNALDELKLYLEKSIESQIDAMEIEYGE